MGMTPGKRLAELIHDTFSNRVNREALNLLDFERCAVDLGQRPRLVAR